MKKLKFYKGDMIDCEIYKLVDFYDPILRKPTIPVKLETLDDFEEARYLAFSLAETLGELDGLGLSANQVGLPHRVCAINVGKEIWTLFNPEIIERSIVPSSYQEGCLSYPGLYLKVHRADWVKVKFQAVGGQWVEQTFSGLTAVCVQHEIDHLDGIMFTDKISPIKLNQAKKKIKKNLKKMKEFAKQQVNAPPPQEPGTKPSRAVIETAKEPEITIFETPKIEKPLQEKPLGKEISPDKFVYRVG